MATSTTTIDILVVTDDRDDPESVTELLGFESDAASVSLATVEEVGERLASQPVDCILCTATLDRERCLGLLSTLDEGDRAVPVLVFAGDRGAAYATDVLDAGAADVVQSTLPATPPALLDRRIEGVLDGTQHQTIQEAKRREREQRLRWYEEIIETTGDTAAVYDENGRFRFVNRRLAQLYDSTPEQLRGEDSSLLAQLRDQSEGGDPYEELVEGHREEYRTELELDYPTQDGRVTDVRLSRLADGDEFRGVVAIGRDVTERTEREAKIARQRDELAKLDRLNAVIRDVDEALVGARTREEIEQAVCERLTEAGRYRFAAALHVESDRTVVPAAWTEAGREVIEAVFPVEVTSETSPGLRALATGETQVVHDIGREAASAPWQDAVLDAGVESLAAIPVTYGDTEYGVVAVFAGETDAFDERELAVLDELGGTVGHAIAAVERREREETLTTLYEATRDLLGTETPQEVSDVVVDVAREVLDLSEVGIFLFDDEDNVLRPASATDELLAFFDGRDTFGPGEDDSETWHAYMTGETKVFDDISQADRVANPETEARSTLVRPLGEHGAFVAASTEVGVFDDQRRKLFGLLATTAETALDRVAGQAGIRERERELEDRTERLERTERISGLMRDITTQVVRTTAREGIERAVCERLADEEGVAFAWIGGVSPDGKTVVPRTWAGEDAGYLDEVSLAVDGTEPAARTAASGTVTVVETVTDHLREHDWARTAADRDYQCVVAVPLTYGETTYGVAAVYATDPDLFEGTADVLAELGELVGYAINSVETKQGVLADRVTELELRIPGPRTFMNAVAGIAGGGVRYLEITPVENERARVLFGLDDVGDVEDVLALEREFVGVESLQHVGNGDRHLFRATVTGRTIAATLLDCGAIPGEVVAHPEVTEAVVELPARLDVREFVDRVRETYPETELVSRRDRSSRDDRYDVRESVESELTERQREVLATAYESGFFESPRKTTGAELADLLDVSQPTVTHHLREGQRRLLSVLLGDDES